MMPRLSWLQHRHTMDIAETNFTHGLSKYVAIFKYLGMIELTCLKEYVVTLKSYQNQHELLCCHSKQCMEKKTQKLKKGGIPR